MVGLAIVLGCYLFAQTIAFRLRRPWRRRFDRVADDLLRDGFLPLPHWRKVEFYRAASHGGWATLRRFARTPRRMLRMTAEPPDQGDGPPDNPIVMKLRELHDLCAKLEWATYPVAFVLMVVASGGVLLAGQAIGLTRGGRPRLDGDIIRRAAIGELVAEARTAFDRRLEIADLLTLHAIPTSSARNT